MSFSTRTPKSSGEEKSSTSKTSTNTVSTSRHSNPDSLQNQYNNYPQYIMYLQRTIGNQGVGRLLRSGELQRKLNIGPANDKYEQEADYIADQVVSMSDAVTQEQHNYQTTKAHTSTLSRKPLISSITPLQRKPLNPELKLQTKPEDEKDEIQEEPIQRQFEATHSDDEGQAKLIQRTCSTCQNEYETAKLQRRSILPFNLCPSCRTSSLQRKFSNFQSKSLQSSFYVQSKPIMQRKDIPSTASYSIESALNLSKYGGKPLSTNERTYFEPRFGTSFANVRLHTDSKAALLSRSINARAFTTGNNIYFGSGEYSPNTIQGKRLMAHELTHTIQQQKQQSNSLQLTPSNEVYGTDDSPLNLPFLGEANSAAELLQLLNELSIENDGQSLGLIGEQYAMGSIPSTGNTNQQQEVIQSSSTNISIQRATVAGCNVPGVASNVIGMIAHSQIQGTCSVICPGCVGEYQIPGDGRADLFRRHIAIPVNSEIGEIKPASWIGRGLIPKAQAQLAGYLAAYAAVNPDVAIPMWSFIFPPEPFAANPTQTLSVWGPSDGLYFYRCNRPRRRQPERRRVPIPSPIPATRPRTVPQITGEDVAKVAAGVGIGYIIYRGIRMIPSLFPPLWPTIPANAAIP